MTQVFGICFEPYVRKTIDVTNLLVIPICPVQEQNGQWEFLP